jgi:hypothetical protein
MIRWLGSILGATLAVACAGVATRPPGPPPPMGRVETKCPDAARPDELAALDFDKDYGLANEAAERLKVGLLTAMEAGVVADRLEADLGIACAQIARDLGATGDWRSGNDACAAAVEAIGEARAKIGSRAELRLVARTPLCLIDPALVSKCASLCDASTPAGRLRAECERRAGRCDGTCDGVCEPRNGARCDGTCMGTCDGTMKGTCGGRCKGTCDGRPVNGGCPGVCAGICERGAISGECKGTCAGGCHLAKAGICEGVCAGSCSVELSEVRCADGLKEPEVSADCGARCDLGMMNVTECSAPQVGLMVAGASHRDAADAVKTAVDRSFPALLKIQGELGERAITIVERAQVVIENARRLLRDRARLGPKADVATLAKCFEGPLERGSTAAAALRGNVERSFALRRAVVEP